MNPIPPKDGSGTNPLNSLQCPHGWRLVDSVFCPQCKAETEASRELDDLANLRDQIAIEAMTATVKAKAGTLTPTELAFWSYAIADAMLAERAKKEGGK